MEKRFEKVTHPFEPVFKDDSKILILGSLPSAKSRENDFYYGHPQNRFWRVLAKIAGEEIPETILEKNEFLLRNKIALWDVIHSCEISGSSDASIKNAVANKIEKILDAAKIKKIILNGGTGTMSERELRISCGSTLAAEIDNPASGFTNAAAMEIGRAHV